MLLTRLEFDMARRFLEEEARSLEAARFHHHFSGTSVDTVIAELAQFQNPDGGFGHGLEPDVRTPVSSVICTTIAFQIMRSLNVPTEHPTRAAGLDFLIKSYNPETQHWRNLPPAAEESPHAPWWSQADDPAAYDEFELNPTAEVLGYLYEGGDRVSRNLINAVTDRVMNEIFAHNSIEMHELLCCLRLWQTPNLPAAVRQPLQDKLQALIHAAVDQDPADWAGYGLRPLQVIDRPDSPFLEGLEAAVEANLDYEIAAQNDQGAWEPTWSWAEDYPDAWAEACREWSGVLTLDKLIVLKRFGRIAAT